MNPILETCPLGHRFYFLPDHPTKDDYKRCPYCMAKGIDFRDEVISDLEFKLAKMLANSDCTCVEDSYPPGECPTCQDIDPPKTEITVCDEALLGY